MSLDVSEGTLPTCVSPDQGEASRHHATDPAVGGHLPGPTGAANNGDTEEHPRVPMVRPGATITNPVTSDDAEDHQQHEEGRVPHVSGQLQPQLHQQKVVGDDGPDGNHPLHLRGSHPPGHPDSEEAPAAPPTGANPSLPANSSASPRASTHPRPDTAPSQPALNTNSCQPPNNTSNSSHDFNATTYRYRSFVTRKESCSFSHVTYVWVTSHYSSSAGRQDSKFF